MPALLYDCPDQHLQVAIIHAFSRRRSQPSLNVRVLRTEEERVAIEISSTQG